MRSVLAFLALVALACARVDFTGHKIVTIDLRNQADADFLLGLPEVTDGVQGIDVLSNDGVLVVGAPARVRLTPAGFKALVASGIPHSVSVHDLQKHIETVSSRKAVVPANSLPDWYHHFQRYDAIVEKLRGLAEAHPQYVKFISSVGTSIEGRKIAAVRLGTARDGANTSVVLGGLHAREWIGESVALWSLQSLLDDYAAGDDEATQILSNTVVYFVPCYNPDGYEYTHEHNRYWRKNRRHNKGTSYGVDLNRNWDSHWCTAGASKVSTSDTYCGTSPLSEPETKDVSKWILGMGQAVQAVLDLHSYSRLVLRPYGWTTEVPADDGVREVEGDKMVSLIKAKHGTVYESIKESDLYAAAGTTTDWTYEKAGAVHSFTFELDGEDFVVEESSIKTQGEEIYPAIKYLLSLSA